MFSLRIEQTTKTSLISYPELLTTTLNPGSFSDSKEMVRYIWENNTGDFWKGE